MKIKLINVLAALVSLIIIYLIGKPIYQSLMDFTLFSVTSITLYVIVIALSIKFFYKPTRASPKDASIISKFLESEVQLRYGINKIEKDYQQDLEQALLLLKERHKYQIKYESTHNDNRIDFLINNKIGIEMKLHKGGSHTRRELYSQVTEYSRYCSFIICLVINVTEEDNLALKTSILEQLSHQHATRNYKVIVVSTI
jgi:hypothetical protein